MFGVAPKPIIAHVVQTWRVPPGMTFALVEDVEGTPWIVESCPAGTHFWTLEQARHLAQGGKTRRALLAAVQAGLERQQTALPTQEPPAPMPAARRSVSRRRIPVQTGRAVRVMERKSTLSTRDPERELACA
jgi:hypothetical protein